MLEQLRGDRSRHTQLADAMADVAAHGRVIVLGSEQAIEPPIRAAGLVEHVPGDGGVLQIVQEFLQSTAVEGERLKIARRIRELWRQVGGRWGAFDPIHVPRPIYGDESHGTCADPRLMHHPRRHVVKAARAELRLFSIALKGGCAGDHRVRLICRMPVLANVKSFGCTNR